MALLFITNRLVAQTNHKDGADAILRVWEDEEKDGRIVFLKNMATYEAKIIYGRQSMEADGKTYQRDIHNPDPALRSRLLKDYILITGLTYDDGKWINGKIYNFKDGKSYDVKLEIKNNLLYMRVFEGISLFGKTLKWHPFQ